MIVRIACQEDIPALSLLAKAVYTHTFGASMTVDELDVILQADKSEAAFCRALLGGDDFLLAEKDKHLIGYLGLTNPDIEVLEGRLPTPKDQALNGIYVDTLHQGQGIGKRLMDAAFQQPRFVMAEYVYLCVWEKNMRAYIFYKNYGFKPVGRCPVRADGEIIGYDCVMARVKS